LAPERSTLEQAVPGAGHCPFAGVFYHGEEAATASPEFPWKEEAGHLARDLPDIKESAFEPPSSGQVSFFYFA
tara:strand:- start:3781 stop:3999 length:219 start_codon:yes stop_codon:yes gene_type:complete